MTAYENIIVMSMFVKNTNVVREMDYHIALFIIADTQIVIKKVLMKDIVVVIITNTKKIK